jgi:hypothetical protein
MRLRIGDVLRVFLVGALAALSLPGVEAARAEADLLPPVAQLFAFDAASPPQRHAAPSAVCGADPNLALRRADADRRAAMARIAALMAAGSDAEVLNGRGYAYPVRRDPSVELVRIQQEARRLAAGAAAH